MSTSDRHSQATAEARDLLRWRSPLRTELWASRLASGFGVDPLDDEAFLQSLGDDPGQEAALTLVALAAISSPEAAAATPPPKKPAPTWTTRLTQATNDGAWYGKADPYGEQTLAALSFHYANAKEPHVLVVAIDQANGGLAVDAVVEEPKFLTDLRLSPADPATVAGRVLDAFDLTHTILGAPAADTLSAVRALALSRTRAIPDPVRHAHDDTAATLDALPAAPGAAEAFAAVKDFLGDRPLWWSPSRASRFLTSWLPREATLSAEAITAMPAVLRAWTETHTDEQHADKILRQIDADAPKLAGLMADESLAGLRKRLSQQE
ncbi:hypothetical protein OIE66_05885 [Nonomuraea sp. NBC_01738]|uniref:hypothetical protein n=1 Tax=Nonomuraea sp. NBC_01738 TaxID=2976003 RepID=UPI002E112DDE|nr:hypothetical protein OIE66_05885 [Nonomuraea sp. NBC_01738]